MVRHATLFSAKSSDEKADEKGDCGEFKRMLFCAVPRQVERIAHFVFNQIDMGGGMLLDVLDNLSGVLFEMIRIFNDGVAGAGECVFYHERLLN